MPNLPPTSPDSQPVAAWLLAGRRGTPWPQTGRCLEKAGAKSVQTRVCSRKCLRGKSSTVDTTRELELGGRAAQRGECWPLGKPGMTREAHQETPKHKPCDESGWGENGLRWKGKRCVYKRSCLDLRVRCKFIKA